MASRLGWQVPLQSKLKLSQKQEREQKKVLKKHMYIKREPIHRGNKKKQKNKKTKQHNKQIKARSNKKIKILCYKQKLPT